MTKAGDTGRLVINGAPQTHKLLVTHLSSEYCLQVEARGRRVDEWSCVLTNLITTGLTVL